MENKQGDGMSSTEISSLYSYYYTVLGKARSFSKRGLCQFFNQVFRKGILSDKINEEEEHIKDACLHKQ